MREGDLVAHIDHGVGTVTFVFGDMASVEFASDIINVEVSELQALTAAQAKRPQRPDVAFRKTFESLVMGVVPSGAYQLLAQTIDAAAWRTRITDWLDGAYDKGACKILAGYYGSGAAPFERRSFDEPKTGLGAA